MSIIANVVTLGGVALSSDGRCLLVDLEESTDENTDIEILGDNFPKIYTLCGRYGLGYTGISRLPFGKWDFRKDMLPMIEKIMGTDKYTIADAAAKLNELLYEILTKGSPRKEKLFSFTLCGYESQDDLPMLIQYADGELLSKIGYFRDRDTFQGGIICSGFTDHIKKLIETQKKEVTQMTIMEALDYAEFLIRHEMKFQERCGGQVYLAVVTHKQCGAIGRLPTGEIYFKG